MNTIPREILDHIFDFTEFQEAIDYMTVSKFFMLVLKNKHWSVEKIYIGDHRDLHVSTKFKFVIKKLVIDDVPGIKNVKLNSLNYRELYLHNINFYGIDEITKIDQNISDKCEKLVIYQSQNSQMSLIKSFCFLKKCTSIHFNDLSKYNCENIKIILNCLKKIPNIKEIGFSHSPHNIKWLLTSFGILSKDFKPSGFVQNSLDSSKKIIYK